MAHTAAANWRWRGVPVAPEEEISNRLAYEHHAIKLSAKWKRREKGQPEAAGHVNCSRRRWRAAMVKLRRTDNFDW
jgi:hypothetical protein